MSTDDIADGVHYDMSGNVIPKDISTSLFAFSNGLFDVTLNRFYKYDSAAHQKHIVGKNLGTPVNVKQTYFSEDGFDIETGEFDWSVNKDSPVSPDFGEVELPPTHWSFINVPSHIIDGGASVSAKRSSEDARRVEVE